MNFRNGNNTLQHVEFDLIKLLFQISKNSHNFLFNTSYRELYIPYHKISYEFESNLNINKQTIQCKKKQKEVTFSEDSLSDESNSDSDKSIRMGLNDYSFTIEHFIDYYENPIIELRNENNADLQYY